MRGVVQIVRFNWPYYAAATVVLVGVEVGMKLVSIPAMARWLLQTLTGLAAVWIVASVAVSWIIYDRSPLSRWEWTRDAVGLHPRCWVNVHAGYDESPPALRRLLPPSNGRVFDIFDRVEMSEPSIARARRLCRPEVDSEPVDFRHLPAPPASIDAAFLLLSAHE